MTLTRSLVPLPGREPAQLLRQTFQEWGGRGDLWIFGYASLIWRPEFEHDEHHMAHVHGWHRALKMWSRVNRGSPECPGLVFGLISGGSCRGMVFRIPRREVEDMLPRLWEREMPTGVYDPRWLHCRTAAGHTVQALAFTLSRRSPNFTGQLSAAQYRRILASARGRYGSTHDYAQTTYRHLLELGIRDQQLEWILRCA